MALETRPIVMGNSIPDTLHPEKEFRYRSLMSLHFGICLTARALGVLFSFNDFSPVQVLSGLLPKGLVHKSRCPIFQRDRRGPAVFGACGPTA